MAFVGVAIVVILLRGPHEHGWIGWHGGAELLRRAKLTDSSPTAVTEVTRWNKEAVEKATGENAQARSGAAGPVDLAELGRAPPTSLLPTAVEDTATK